MGLNNTLLKNEGNFDIFNLERGGKGHSQSVVLPLKKNAQKMTTKPKKSTTIKIKKIELISTIM